MLTFDPAQPPGYSRDGHPSVANMIEKALPVPPPSLGAPSVPEGALVVAGACPLYKQLKLY